MTRWRNSRRAGFGRGTEDLLRRTFLEDPAPMQEAHPVADLAGEGHLVGGEQHRHARRP